MLRHVALFGLRYSGLLYSLYSFFVFRYSFWVSTVCSPCATSGRIPIRR
jgi:hypothetical protein